MKNARSHTLVRLTLANPASAAYLALVGVAMAVAALQPLVAPGSDASMIWVWPAFFTLPTFGFFAWLGSAAETPALLLTGGIVVSALVQSLMLGAAWESWRERGRGRRLGSA
ncbi:SCO4225 family membrane protein [Streptomyces ziwulingensis]|uniref:Integral membrane protein n=1 Tax=Streptomyces ziwulingensis TaxID=1045501 RepID=A0ABP9AZ36_9ACTN